MPDNIFIIKSKVRTGPFSESKVRKMLWGGSASFDDFAWHNGLSEWKPLCAVINFGADQIELLRTRKEIEREDNPWTVILKWGLLGMACALLVMPENVIRLFGFFLMPDFHESQAIRYGEFVREDGMGRIAEVSDHIYISEFTTSSGFWRFFIKNDILLSLPLAGIFALAGIRGSNYFNAFVAERIAKLRLKNMDERLERRLWISASVGAVIVPALVSFLFGYGRLVPIT